MSEADAEAYRFAHAAALAKREVFSIRTCLACYARGVYLYFTFLFAQPKRALSPSCFIDPFVPPWVSRMPFAVGFTWMLFFQLPKGIFDSVKMVVTNRDGFDLERNQSRLEGSEHKCRNGFFAKLGQYAYYGIALQIARLVAKEKTQGMDSAYWFSKDLFRGVLAKAGCTIPTCIARWNKKKGEIEWKLPLPQCDLVVKTAFGALGNGDMFMKYGVDFTSKEDVERLFHERRQQNSAVGEKDMLFLQRVMPEANLGVHNIELLTARKIGSETEVVCIHSTMYCGKNKSNSWSSHGCQNCYLLDPVSEKAIGPEPWLRIRQAFPVDPSTDGCSIPGLRNLMHQAIKAHQELLKAKTSQDFKMFNYFKGFSTEDFEVVGWDVMLTEDGGYVFFEGNHSLLRLARFILCSWEATSLIAPFLKTSRDRGSCW